MLPSPRKFPHSLPCQSSPSHRRKPLLSSITIDYFNLYLHFLKTESFIITLSYLIFFADYYSNVVSMLFWTSAVCSFCCTVFCYMNIPQCIYPRLYINGHLDSFLFGAIRMKVLGSG